MSHAPNDGIHVRPGTPFSGNRIRLCGGSESTAATQPWLYICYPDSLDHPDPTNPLTTSSGADLNVVLLMSYGPMTASVPTPLGGILGLSSNLRVRIQGG